MTENVPAIFQVVLILPHTTRAVAVIECGKISDSDLVPIN